MVKNPTHSGKLIGRALLIGRRIAAEDSEALAAQGLQVEFAVDPYAAIAELASRPLVYRALLLPIPQLFHEELALVRVVKKRFPHVQIIASELPARSNRADELRRLGVDAILSDMELHPLIALTKSETTAPPVQVKAAIDPEPVLSAEELRALLSDEVLPPSGTERP